MTQRITPLTPHDMDVAEADGQAEPVAGWSPFNLVWMSLLAVAVWPMLGVAACRHLLDAPSEAALLFGGFTGCLLYPVALIVGSNDIAFMGVLMFLWLLMWLIPIGWLVRHPQRRWIQGIVIAALSGISFGQAALGYLMILGKGV